MQTNDTGIDHPLAHLTAGVTGGSTATADWAPPAQPTMPVPCSGRGHLTVTSRTAAGHPARPALEARASLSVERVGEIRRRILEGAYNSVEMVEEVARRILERGDV